MALPEADSSDLARAIAAAVPEGLLKKIIESHRIVPAYAEFALAAAAGASEAYIAVCLATVKTYDNANKLPDLLRLLYSEVHWDIFLRDLVERTLGSIGTPIDNRQALRRTRDHFVLGPNLTRFVVDILPRICCIVGEWGAVGTSGTGCLVGPDLVLTAMHVFEPLIALHGHDAVPKNYAVYFDHTSDPQIVSVHDNRRHLRRVELHPDQWLLASSPGFPRDGQIADPTDTDLQAMAASLDFALIRLNEPVGFQSIDVSGGRQRRWIQFSDPNRLLAQQRVIIPQHPQGLSQRVDWGKYERMFGNETRFHYDTETDEGTSGAPCFDAEFRFLGLHNSSFCPNAIPPDQHRNQAIHIEPIRPLLTPHLQTAGPAPSVPLWNIRSDPQQLKVILGRKPLLDWLERAESDQVPQRSSRIYAAVSEHKGRGSKFTVEILEAFCRDRKSDRVILLGSQKDLLPNTLPDLIRVLADHFGVPASSALGMPLRPDASLPAGDGDKTTRWSSVVVPEWFAGVLERHRTERIDRREIARKIVRESEAFGLKISKEVRRAADSPEALLVEEPRWEKAWIVIQLQRGANIDQDVANFLAGMAGIKSDDVPLPAPLHRLRWLFVGPRLDFLPGSGIVTEELDRSVYGREEVSSLLKHALAARGITARDVDVATVLEVIRIASQLPAESQMNGIQTLVSIAVRGILQQSGGDHDSIAA